MINVDHPSEYRTWLARRRGLPEPFSASFESFFAHTGERPSPRHVLSLGDDLRWILRSERGRLAAEEAPYVLSSEAVSVTSKLVAAPCREVLDGFLLRHRTEVSARSARSALGMVARLLGETPESIPWQLLGPKEVSLLAALLAKHYRPSTANLCLTMLKGVLRECWRQGLLADGVIQRIEDVPSVRGSREPRGRALSQDELRRLFLASSQARDAAIVGVLCVGLRRAEVVSLERSSVIETTGGGLQLRVVGKGNKERTVDLPEGSRDALRLWLTERGWTPGALFFGRGQKPLRGGGIWQIVQRLSKKAKISPAPGPHDFRRTFAGNMLSLPGVDLATVQKLLGHASPVTTQLYDRRPADARKAAMAKLDVPFMKR